MHISRNAVAGLREQIDAERGVPTAPIPVHTA